MVKRFDAERPVESFKALLTDLLKGYSFDVIGLHLKDGTVYPLPSESALIGKILELSIKEYLHRKLVQVKNLRWMPGGERTYPDLTFNGPTIFPNRFAVDVKCARRNTTGTRTQSAITIGTFDAEYYRYPDRKAANILMPYQDYTAHLAIIALYDYRDGTAQHIELLVVEKWRVATRKRASGTRCYIAAVNNLVKLKAEQGDFSSEDEFNAYWRDRDISSTKQSRAAADE